jgi:hypothetical protein
MPARYSANHGQDELLVLIPHAPHRRGEKRVRRIERAVRWLWSRGIYPGPAALSLRLHGRATRSINGVETSVRNRMLEELGIRRQRTYREDPARIELPVPRTCRVWP